MNDALPMSSTQGRFNKGPLDPEAKNPEKNHVAGKLRAIQEERPNSVKNPGGEKKDRFNPVPTGPNNSRRRLSGVNKEQ